MTRRTLSASLVLVAAMVSQQPASSQSAKAALASKPVVAVIDFVDIHGGQSLTPEEKTALANRTSGETTSVDWLGRMKAAAENELRNDGFWHPSITATAENTTIVGGVQHATVSLDVAEGKRSSLAKVWWAGSSLFTPVELDAISGLHTGGTLSADALTRTVELIQDAYHDRGYDKAAALPQVQVFPNGSAIVYFEIVEGQKSAGTEARATGSCTKVSTDDARLRAFIPSNSYDSKRDAQFDLARAELEAQRTGKRVLVFVGGLWCPPCVALEHAFQNNASLRALRDNKFITVYLSVRGDWAHDCALQAFPQIDAVPAVFVLDAAGKVLAQFDPNRWAALDGFSPTRIENDLNR